MIAEEIGFNGSNRFSMRGALNSQPKREAIA